MENLPPNSERSKNVTPDDINRYRNCGQSMWISGFVFTFLGVAAQFLVKKDLTKEFIKSNPKLLEAENTLNEVTEAFDKKPNDPDGATSDDVDFFRERYDEVFKIACQNNKEEKYKDICSGQITKDKFNTKFQDRRNIVNQARTGEMSSKVSALRQTVVKERQADQTASDLTRLKADEAALIATRFARGSGSGSGSGAGGSGAGGSGAGGSGSGSGSGSQAVAVYGSGGGTGRAQNSSSIVNAAQAKAGTATVADLITQIGGAAPRQQQNSSSFDSSPLQPASSSVSLSNTGKNLTDFFVPLSQAR